jgi:uncharacterized protein (DUF302 family)
MRASSFVPRPFWCSEIRHSARKFITSNPNARLDWPVRLLLTQDDNGDVWAAWTDFEWIARRHNIRDREAQFKMATKVVQSITSTITTK